MLCHISEQISAQAYVGMKEENKEIINENAIFDLFQDCKGHFTNGEIELCDVIDKTFKDEYQLASGLFMRMLMGDLHAKTEATLLVSGIAKQMNEEMANRY